LKAKAAERPTENQDDSKYQAEIKRLFCFIGSYVVAFQDIESKLDQIIQLAIGLDRWHVSHNIITLLSHSQKIDLVRALVHSSQIADGTEHKQRWIESFDEVIQRLRAEATRRNTIVHSLYIFDFMKIGAPPLRSKRKRKFDAIAFDQEHIDADSISQATSDVTKLSFDIGMALVQLRYWSEQLGRQRS
jgi:hypothetical protein